MPEQTHAHILTIEDEPGIAFTQALNPGLIILDARLLYGEVRPQY